MFPVGQTTGGPGPVGPPQNLSQSSNIAGSNSLGLGGLGPIMSPVNSSQSGSSIGAPPGMITSTDSSPIGQQGMPSSTLLSGPSSTGSVTGSSSLMSSSGNGSSSSSILPLGGIGTGTFLNKSIPTLNLKLNKSLF